MACEPNYPLSLSGDCLTTVIGAFTGQTSVVAALGAGYHVQGWLMGEFIDNRMSVLDEAAATDLQKLAQAIETAPEGLIFGAGGGDEPAQAIDPGTLLTLFKLLLPLILELLRRRAGGG